MFPSKVISDQYKSVTLATQDGKVYNGMPIVTDGPNLVLLLSDGRSHRPKSEIEEQKASPTSVMPDGLLNPLCYQEIADLLALFNAQPRVRGAGGGGEGEVIVQALADCLSPREREKVAVRPDEGRVACQGFCPGPAPALRAPSPGVPARRLAGQAPAFSREWEKVAGRPDEGVSPPLPAHGREA